MNRIERKQLTTKAEKIIECYNLIGLDAVALGELDFAAGFEQLLAYKHTARFPWLCANLISNETGRPVFDPYVVIGRRGLKVGVIGVLDHDTVLPASDPWSRKVRVAPVHSVVRSLSKRLREDGCDVIVVLSSLEPKKLRLLAKSSREVDLFIGGDPMDKLVLPYATQTALIACGSQLGKYLGHVEFPMDGRSKPGAAKHSFVAMKPEHRDDPAIRRIVDGYYKSLAQLRRQEPGLYVREVEETVNLQQGNPVYVSAEECRRCHEAQYRKWKATKHARALVDLPPAARGNVECLECHVTGFAKWGGFTALSAKPDLSGVQCEECHGAGSSHPATPRMMTGKTVQGVCKRCHTKSRSPDFDLREHLPKVACRATSA